MMTRAGNVTVLPDKQHYATGEAITAAIANGLTSRVLAADHQSGCTVVVVEREVARVWQPQNLCQLKSPTRLIPIGAGAALTQQVPPPSSAGSAGWPVGTYRLALRYRLSPGDQDTTIYSATFSIA
jgi:hypothetical protein